MTIDLDGKRLLLIKPSSLGDVCHAAATAWALKERWPTLHLTWLVNLPFEPLIRPLECVDATIPFERNRFKGLMQTFGRSGELRSFTGTLRSGDFDVVLDMQGLFRSGAFSWLSKARVRIGEASARELSTLFYTHKVDTPKQPVHARDRYAAMAEFLECKQPSREDLDVSDDERKAIHERLGVAEDKIVSICPSARWESKVWPAAEFSALMKLINEAQSGIKFVLTGTPDMAAICDDIRLACDGIDIVDLCGQTDLRELAALMDVSDLLISCDSGPMHIAAAQGTNVVAIFGSTDPIRTGPYGQLQNVVTGECSEMPCLKRKCPGLGTMCMRELHAADVVEKALKLL
ncbi:MAG: glycosyltransferase family 9 protein [Planctomycetota bacterium]|jgi:lipopolysaccharide heptosyltransferase I